MKKIFISLSLITALIACNSSDSNQSAATENTAAAGGVSQDEAAATPEAAPAATDLSSNPDYQAGLGLTAKSDCATCHNIDEKLVGPAFREIAAKYTNDEATVEKLAQKVINGGAGNWGQVPMSAHPQLSKEDAKAMVKYVLLLKK